jgi:hypothetical protein
MELSAQELSEMRIRQMEEEDIRRKTWPEQPQKELVFEPKLVKDALKADREQHTTAIKSKLP